MASYTSYDEAFNNNNNLDKLARQLNNNKKKLHKKQNNNIEKRESDEYFSLNCLNDPNNIKYAPNLKNAGFFSTQGDFSSKISTLEKKYLDQSKSDSDSTFTKSTTYSDDSNIYQNSIYPSTKFDQTDKWPTTEQDISSDYSTLTPKMKKKFRQTTKHLKKYDDTEEKNVMIHIQKCEQCQNDLINIVQNRHTLSNKINTLSDKNILNISHPELILILIGIFIIIFIDVFFRK